MAVDLQKQRSATVIARAIADYGEELTDPSYHHFAYLIAEGYSATRAYKVLHPEASERTAKKQASVLCAHPDMPTMIRDQLVGAHALADAYAPQALRDLVKLSRKATKETKPRIDAVNSLLDRGGLPRSKQISISVGMAG